MDYRKGKLCLITLSLFFATGMAFANTQKSVTTGQPASSSQATKPDSQAKNGKTINAVDINNASKAELKTLPGIDDALAKKIIAGRPYLSKAFLVTRDIIPMGVYQQINKKIIAMQK